MPSTREAWREEAKRDIPLNRLTGFNQKVAGALHRRGVPIMAGIQNERLNEGHLLIPLRLLDPEPAEGFGAQTQDLMFARIPAVLSWDEDVEMAIHAPNGIDEERHEADNGAVEREPELFGIPGEFISMLLHQVLRVLCLRAFDRRLKFRQLLVEPTTPVRLRGSERTEHQEMHILFELAGLFRPFRRSALPRTRRVMGQELNGCGGRIITILVHEIYEIAKIFLYSETVVAMFIHTLNRFKEARLYRRIENSCGSRC